VAGFDVAVVFADSVVVLMMLGVGLAARPRVTKTPQPLPAVGFC